MASGGCWVVIDGKKVAAMRGENGKLFDKDGKELIAAKKRPASKPKGKE